MFQDSYITNLNKYILYSTRSKYLATIRSKKFALIFLVNIVRILILWI